MKRAIGLFALVLVVSLLGTSDVHGGFAGGLTGRTTGPALTATVVVDVTGPPHTDGRGVTAIRVQRAGASAAVIYTSNIIKQSGASCAQIVQEGANARFQGLMNTWVDPFSVRQALLGQFGDPDKAAITDTDYAQCTTVDGRDILSLTAVIQFQQ